MKTRIVLPSSFLVCLAAGGGYYWWEQHRPLRPAGVAYGNGRTEANEIDIATKFLGRIAEVLVDEGDVAKAGQLVARMDTRDQKATLGKDEALVLHARNTLDNRVAQQKTVVDLAKLELDRTTILVRQGYATRQLSDQQQHLNAANAAVTMAFAGLGEAKQALDASEHIVALDQVNIADNSLK